MWWTGTGTVLTGLDDPRWNGAVSQDFNGEVTFRALHRTGPPDTLFLSWTVKVDQTIDPVDFNANTGDQLVVGFKQQTGPAVFIHLGLSTWPLVAQYNLGVQVYTWNGTGMPASVSPPWISGALRVWDWQDNVSNKAGWTFQMVVPVGTMPNGVDLNPTIIKPVEMFYAFLVAMPSSVVEYNWGTPSPLTSAVSLPNPMSPWGNVSWGASSTNCAGDVALDANQIGVNDPPVNQINYTIQNNLITAKPKNISTDPLNTNTNPIGAGRIQADFFLSNYGSQIANFGPWTKMTTSSPINNAPISQGGFGVIQFQWPMRALTAPEKCLYDDRDPLVSGCPQRGISDQCILVQLSEVTPPPTPPPPSTPPPAHPSLVFRNQSVYNNMLFKSASSLRHRAQISVAGLKPLADNRTTRDVYLYVETVNMPEKVSGAALGPAVTGTHDTMFVARRDTSLRFDWGVIRLARGDSLRIPLKHTLLAAGSSAGERFAAVQRAAQSGNLTVPEVDVQVPTFRIHAYHATGDSLGKVPILEPQTSFGYWVKHDGEIIGWRHRIEGEHLVQLAPNYYKIEVPNNGRAIITTVIEALPWRPFALSLHGAISLPTGNFKSSYDQGFGSTLDAEYWWTRRLALQALFGYHRFGGKGTNPDLEVVHASAGLEVRLTSSSPSLLVEGGGGTYHFKPGSSKTGTYGGVSVAFDVSPRVSLGVNGRLHTVFTTGTNTTFYSIQAGWRVTL